MKFYTTKKAAEKLNYTSDAVIRKLIERKQLKAEKFGHMWLIPEEDLEKIKRIRKPYRKKKSS
jgi:excisionase family DNA binding protein